MNNPLTPIAGLFNRWSVFHAGAGLVLAKLFFRMNLSHPLLIVLGIAVVWEVMEIIIDGTYRTYGTIRAWAMDTILDIALALVFGWVAIN